VPSSAKPMAVAPLDHAKLLQSNDDLKNDAGVSLMKGTRHGNLTTVGILREAAAVADLIGGAAGLHRNIHVFYVISHCQLALGDVTAAAGAAFASQRAARAVGSRTELVKALALAGTVALDGPDAMARTESEGRQQERTSRYSTYGLDLSKEGRIRLPSTPADLSRLSRTYCEAAVAVCDASVAAVGRGPGSPARVELDSRRRPEAPLGSPC